MKFHRKIAATTLCAAVLLGGLHLARQNEDTAVQSNVAQHSKIKLTESGPPRPSIKVAADVAPPDSAEIPRNFADGETNNAIGDAARSDWSGQAEASLDGDVHQQAESPSFEAVLELLDNSDEAVIISALSALEYHDASLDAHSAEIKIANLLTHPSPAVRVQALVKQAEWGDPANTQVAIENALFDSDPSVQIEAMHLLESQEMSEPKIKEILLSFIRDYPADSDVAINAKDTVVYHFKVPEAALVW